MATVAAIRCHPTIQAFHQKLTARGKPAAEPPPPKWSTLR